MDLKQQLSRIQYIDHLIRSKQANSLRDISAKVNITTRQVQNILNVMKDLGAPIKYNEREKCYYYEEDKKFVFKYE